MKETNIVSQNHTGLMETESSVRGRILKILERCDKRLERDPEDTDALFSKGLTLARLKRYEEAIQCLDRILEIKPDYPAVWRLKATIYTLMRDYKMFLFCKKMADEQS
jgi:tetratricopeptide (TPR) repeat protein